MIKYPKIKTVYLRDPAMKYKTLLEGQYALPEFKYLADNEWEWTEKIDGTNIRVQWGQGEGPPLATPFHLVSFHGRTDKAQTPLFLLTKLQEMFPVGKFLHLPPMTLYGEGYGARIQKGGGNYISDGVSFILFDVRVNDLWLKREDVRDIASKLGIGSVPVVGYGTLQKAIGLTRIGLQSRVGVQMAEGLVMRPSTELFTRRGQRIITKIKYKDFEGRSVASCDRGDNMTGYHIAIGYNGATRVDYDEMWEILKRKTREVCEQPQAIIDEARRLGSPETCSRGCCTLGTYADNYADPYEICGHPITIIEDKQQIMQLASTDSAMKYHVRRAFVRLLIEAMHREEIEVSLVVA